MQRVVVITPPEATPVTVDDVKAHLRVEHGDDDTLLGVFIGAAVKHVDGPGGTLGRALINQTLELRVPCLPWCGQLRLPYPPILSAVTSLKYISTAGTELTLDPGEYTKIGDPERDPAVALGFGKSWPATRRQPEAVAIQYVAGYGANPGDVPEPIRVALMIMVGDMYANRGQHADKPLQELPTVARLLSSYRSFA